jgi:hypothetical protein
MPRPGCRQLSLLGGAKCLRGITLESQSYTIIQHYVDNVVASFSLRRGRVAAYDHRRRIP